MAIQKPEFDIGQSFKLPNGSTNKLCDVRAEYHYLVEYDDGTRTWHKGDFVKVFIANASVKPKKSRSKPVPTASHAEGLVPPEVV